MDFKVRFLKYENDDFIIGKVYDVANGTIVDEKHYPFTSWSESGNAFENLKEWFEEDDGSCEVELVTDEIKQQFKKSDFKDGMIITYRNGVKRLVYNSNIYTLNNEQTLSLIDGVKYLKEGLKNGDGYYSLDIIKVEYMGKSIWQRKEKEYMTLEEASRTGKGYKHKDCTTYYYCPQNALTHAIGITHRDMFDLLKAKEFEVVES